MVTLSVQRPELAIQYRHFYKTEIEEIRIK